MAKGKEALSSARRRLAATEAHLDRLTDQLAEAKLRARLVEQSASRVPDLEHRIQVLTDETAGPLAEQRDRHEDEMADLMDRFGHLCELFAKFIDSGGFTAEEWGEVRGLLGPLHERFESFNAGRRSLKRNSNLSPKRLAAMFRFQRQALNSDSGPLGQYMRSIEPPA